MPGPKGDDSPGCCFLVSVQLNSSHRSALLSINIWYFTHNPESQQKWGSVRTVLTMWFGSMSNHWACLLSGEDVPTGYALTLSAARVSYFVAQNFSKSLILLLFWSSWSQCICLTILSMSWGMTQQYTVDSLDSVYSAWWYTAFWITHNARGVKWKVCQTV